MIPSSRVSLNAVALAVLFCLCALPVSQPSPAQASVVQALSLAQLTYKADEILIVMPVEQHARRHSDGKLIVTDFSLRVQEVLKGKLKAGDTAVATVLGGKLEGLALQVPGEASFKLGDRAIAFLYRSPKSGDLRVVGMSQGVLPLEDEEARTLVMPSGGGAELVQRGGDGRLSEAQGAITQPELLSDVVGRIRGIVAQQTK
jgi:hypothetical protein